MPTKPPDDDAWGRVAEKLIARRVEIDPRYRNRRLFCEETGLDYKVVSDIELSRRTNFGRETLALIEIGYRWEAGSIRRTLSGLEPTPRAERAEEPAADYPDWVGDDELCRYIWDGPGPEVVRQMAITVVQTYQKSMVAALRRPDERDERRHA